MKTDSDGCGLDIFSTLKGAEVTWLIVRFIREVVVTQSASVFVLVVSVVYRYRFSCRSPKVLFEEPK